MPREKNRSNKGSTAPAPPPADDDDNVSISSDRTESTAQNASDGEEIISDIEKYENNVKLAMDLATEKSVKTRTNALLSLTTAFQKRLLVDFLENNYQTVTDLAERGLRKGKGAEQVAAAKLASVLVASLAETKEAEQIYKTLEGPLKVIVQDPSASLLARQESALTLGFLCFLASDDLSEVAETMTILRTIFSASFLKGNGDIPAHPPAVSALHTAALNAWCLLLCLLPSNNVHELASKHIGQLKCLLLSSDVDLRIMAGDAIALLYEGARDHNDYFHCHAQTQLCDLLRELATDSSKHRAKKDRKTQRASFREVLKTVEEKDTPYVTVTFGPKFQKQILTIDSWTFKRQYDTLCHVFGEGLSTHMTWNQPMRDMFDLGPPPSRMASLFVRRSNKNQRESAACKARHLARSKNRDNRAACLTYDD